MMKYRTIANIDKPISRLVLGPMIVSDQTHSASARMRACTGQVTADACAGTGTSSFLAEWIVRSRSEVSESSRARSRRVRLVPAISAPRAPAMGEIVRFVAGLSISIMSLILV